MRWKCRSKSVHRMSQKQNRVVWDRITCKSTTKYIRNWDSKHLRGNNLTDYISKIRIDKFTSMRSRPKLMCTAINSTKMHRNSHSLSKMNTPSRRKKERGFTLNARSTLKQWGEISCQCHLKKNGWSLSTRFCSPGTRCQKEVVM